MFAALAATLAVLTAGVATPASAAPDDTCTGVWVVVDGTALGGEVALGCAASHATGTDALASAGFDVARSGGMLCRLDGLPEECTIASTAYWSYWQATPAGDGYEEWSYANLGPDSYHPRGGDAEGWVFGDGRTPPSVLPQTLAEPGATTRYTPVADTAETTAPAESDAAWASGSPRTLIIVVGVVVLVALGAWIARRRAG